MNIKKKKSIKLVILIGLSAALFFVLSYLFTQKKNFSLSDFERLESKLENTIKSEIEDTTDNNCKKTENLKNLPKVLEFVSSVISMYLVLVNSYSFDCVKDTDETIEYECIKAKNILIGELIKSHKKNKIKKIYAGLELEGLEIRLVISEGEGNVSPTNLNIKNSKFAIENKTPQLSPSSPLFGYLGGEIYLRKVGENNNFIFKYSGIFKLSYLQGEEYMIDFENFSCLFSIAEGKISVNIETNGCIKSENECECFELKTDKMEIFMGGIITNEPICEADGKIILNGKEITLSSGIIKTGERKLFCDEIY
ncbi:MAG: hypothetical protein N2254_02150 [bacterium]|nr:hypothetical protein [bacterium]